MPLLGPFSCGTEALKFSLSANMFLIDAAVIWFHRAISAKQEPSPRPRRSAFGCEGISTHPVNHLNAGTGASGLLAVGRFAKTVFWNSSRPVFPAMNPSRKNRETEPTVRIWHITEPAISVDLPTRHAG